MKKIDILRENLCIHKIIAVVKGHNPHLHKLSKVNGRRCDAFVYILSGSCTYRFDDGREMTVFAGDLLYLSNQSVYTLCVQTTDYRYIYCDFFFLESAPRMGDSYSYQNLKHLDGYFLKLYNCYTAAPVNSHAECMAILYQIYSLLRQNAARSYLAGGAGDTVELAKRRIDEDFHNLELSISALAEEVGISEVYLRGLFKRKYAVSPAQYLISVRLEHAKRLLKYSSLNLEECAAQSGFSSAQYFCRIFKKETGISPGKYRRSF